MNENMVAVEIEDTRPLRAQEVEARLHHLRDELEINGRLNAALIQAAGIAAFDVPEDLLREIEEVTARVRNAGPVSRADLPDELRRRLAEINDLREPPPASTR